MNISFKRNRTQVYIEEQLGISSIEELNARKQEFKEYRLNHIDVIAIRELICFDAVDYLNNGLISFLEGLEYVCDNKYTWATVKLYYSIFYFLRASMASNHYAILQNNSMFRLKIAEGEQPYSTGNKKYNSTHGGTIAHYKDVFSGADKLLTNKIDEEDVYNWMEGVRNIVNYREVGFLDPNCLGIWNQYFNSIEENRLEILIDDLIGDLSYVYCFQEEYAVVAIPVKRLLQTIVDFKNNNTFNIATNDKIDYIIELIPEKIKETNLTRIIQSCK